MSIEKLSYYREIFDSEWTRNKRTYDSMAASSDGRVYYNFQYTLAATLSMFEATKDVKYLEQALTWGLKMVSVATIIDTNGNKNWGKIWLSPYSKSLIAYMLDDFQGSTELARMARIVIGNPALKAVYSNQATSIYNFVRDHIVNKHLFARKGLPAMRAWLARQDAAANDKPTLLTNILIDVKMASEAMGGVDNSKWNYPAILKDFASGLLDHFGKKARFEPYKGAMIWDLYLPFEEPFRGVDTGHANRMPCAVIELWRCGLSFQKSHILGLGDLLTKVIWNQDKNNPMFTNGIDGGNAPFRNRGPWAAGLIYSGWPKLAEFHDGIFEVCDLTLKAIIAGKRNPSLDYNSTTFGRLCLSGFLGKATVMRERPETIPAAPENLMVTVSGNLIALKWEAVSNAAGYRLKRSLTTGGPYTQIGADLPAIAIGFGDSGLETGTTYFYIVTAFNAVGESKKSNEAQGTIMPESCVTVTGAGVWVNNSFQDQVSIFTSEFDVIPTAGVDAVVGLSQATVTDYAGQACIIRFRANGAIDARNGSSYATVAPTLKWGAGKTYHCRLVVDVSKHTYSIFVTPPGASEILIGSYYAFRTEQQAITKLANWSAVVATVGSIQVCNFKPAKQPDVFRTLSVQSLNPETGVIILASPLDKDGNGGGQTPFTRTYIDGTSVTLSAPALFGSNNFHHWEKDGVSLSDSLDVTGKVDADSTVTAVYVVVIHPPETPPLNFHLDGNALILSWEGAGFVLQSSATPDDSTSWVNVSDASPVSVPAVEDGGIKYFRLLWVPTD